MSRDYEIGFILNPEVSQDEIRALLDRIEQIVASYGSQIVKVNQWGRRRLAYPIERHHDGYYIFIDSILTPETVAEIERTLRVSEIVLRHMTKRRDPKVVQKEREARAAAAAQAEAAAAQAEAVSQTEAAAAQAEAAAAQAEASTTTIEAENQTEVAVEDKTEAEEVAASPVAEEAVTLSPEEVNSAPPAIENPETIEA